MPENTRPAGKVEMVLAKCNQDRALADYFDRLHISQETVHAIVTVLTGLVEVEQHIATLEDREAAEEQTDLLFDRPLNHLLRQYAWLENDRLGGLLLAQVFLTYAHGKEPQYTHSYDRNRSRWGDKRRR